MRKDPQGGEDSPLRIFRRNTGGIYKRRNWKVSQQFEKEFTYEDFVRDQ